MSYYEKALTFPTKSLSAFAGLAFTYHLMVFFRSSSVYGSVKYFSAVMLFWYIIICKYVYIGCKLWFVKGDLASLSGLILGPLIGPFDKENSLWLFVVAYETNLQLMVLIG